MTKEHKTIIERVQKLLSLQQGAEEIGSLEEAANAAEKVQRLLFKYNLEMADVSRHQPETAQSMGKSALANVIAKKNEGQWIYRLYQVLAAHNFCDTVYTSYRMDNRKKNKYVNLIGTKDNVEVVKFLAEQIEARLRISEKVAWKEGQTYGEKHGAFQRGYFMGACHGIDAQLHRSRQEMEKNNSDVTTLVIQNDKALAKAVKGLFPNLRAGRRTKALSGTIGGQLGYTDGNSMSINNGIGNSDQSKAIQR